MEVKPSRDSEAVRAACGREGCPICTVVGEYLEQLMDSWEFEGFSDVEHRHALIRSRGFCPLHTWQLAQRSNAFRLGIIYSEILTDVVRELQQDDSGFAPSVSAGEKGSSILYGWWGRWRKHQHENPQHGECPFCRRRATIEHRLISMLVQQLQVEEMRMLLSQSTGLCLDHYAQARQQAEADNPLVVHHVIACQQMCIQRVLGEVRELVRKHDYRFSDEPQGSEMTSWRRAAQICAGNPGVR